MMHNDTVSHLKQWLRSQLLHTHDHWGTKFNKPLIPFTWRYTVGLTTYRRGVITGLKAWWRYTVKTPKLYGGYPIYDDKNLVAIRAKDGSECFNPL